MTITRRNMLGNALTATAGAVVLGASATPNPIPTNSGPVTNLSAVTGRQKILWVWAHPDDETIAAGGSKRQHFVAKDASGNPKYEMHILMCTRGTGSGVRPYINGNGQSLSDWGVPHVPADEGYAPLTDGTTGTFGEARIREYTNAVRELTSGSGNTMIFHEAGLTDTEVTKSQVTSAINAVYNAIAVAGEDVWLKGHTDVVDDNPDHIAVGQAIRAATFTTNKRFYVEEQYQGDTRWSQVGKHTYLMTATETAYVKNAYKAYDSWAPAQGLFAIGHQSVPGYWGFPGTNWYHL